MHVADRTANKNLAIRPAYGGKTGLASSAATAGGRVSSLECLWFLLASAEVKKYPMRFHGIMSEAMNLGSLINGISSFLHVTAVHGESKVARLVEG